MGKPERNRPLRKPKRKWDDCVWTDVKDAGWGGKDCNYLAQDRKRRDLVNAVMNLRVS